MTRVDTPTSTGQSTSVAPIAGGASGGPVRIAVGSDRGLLIFEPPSAPPRDGVAFDGDAATLQRVEGDASEVPEAMGAEAEAAARSLAISRRAFAGSGAQHVVLASAAGFADALSASPLLNDGPLLLTPLSCSQRPSRWRSTVSSRVEVGGETLVDRLFVVVVVTLWARGVGPAGGEARLTVA